MAKTKRERERNRGNRKADRHERRQLQHSGGGEWDCLRIPDGLNVFKPEGDVTYHIDIVPYIVGKLNKNADPGDEYFELSYPVYRGLGIDEKKYIAIGELLNQRDPVAEHFARLRKEGADWDDMKQFKPTWRQLMLFFVHEQAEKGLQLFEGAYGTFGELLDEEIKANDEEYIDNFDDPDGGSTLVVRFKAKSIGQKKPWILASKINFKEREKGFTANGDAKTAAEVLEKAEGICLDELLKIAEYDTLKKVLDGEPLSERDDDDEPEEKTKKKPKPTPEPEPEDDDEEPEEKPKKGSDKKPAPPTAEDLGIEKGGTVEHDDLGTCTVLRVSKDGLTITIQDEDDEIHKDIDVTDVEPVKAKKKPKPVPEPEEDDEEPEEKPKKGGKKPAPEPEEKPKKGSKKDDDWDDDWDDDK